MKFFPFTVYGRNPGMLLREVFIAGKPEGKSFYEYDVLVISSTSVEFVAYDLKCMSSGGRGRMTFRFKSKVSKDKTRALIHGQLDRLARDEWVRLEEERKASEVKSIRRMLKETYGV